MSTGRKAILVATLRLLAGWASAAPVVTADEVAARFFEEKIRPTLAEQCYDCHGPTSGKGKAKLRVDSREALLRGGESGPAIVPGEPDRSLLLLAIRHDGAVAMPPKTKLDQADIDAIAVWVKNGAPWPSGPGVKAAASAPVATTDGRLAWGKEARAFWAFQPVTSPSPPSVADTNWPRSPIDRFILARLEAAGLHPAPPADRRTLIRRVTLDLIGLPPTPEEVEAFVRRPGGRRLRARRRPAARLAPLRRALGPALARRRPLRRQQRDGRQPRLLRRLALSRLRHRRVQRRQAVTTAFVEEQLAGDLLADADPKRRDERIVATGFLAIGPKMLAEDDPVKQQMDIVDEQLDTTSRVFLGLTIGCARCHDHKFDPIAMSDYYALAGIFKSTRTMLSFRVDSKWNTTGLDNAQAALRLEDLEQIIDRHDNALVNGNTNAMPAEERAARAKLLEDAKAEYAAIPKAMAVAEGSVGDARDLPARQPPDPRAGRPPRLPDDPGGPRPAALDPRRRAAGWSWHAGWRARPIR